MMAFRFGAQASQHKRRREAESPEPPEIVSSSTVEGNNAGVNQDVIMMTLVENINTAVELEETKLIEASLQVLLGMQLNLPEHRALRENLSKTKLIDNLIQVVGYKPANRGFGVDIRRRRHYTNTASSSVNLTSDAIQLISHLLSNQGPGTSTIRHAHGVLDSLCDKLSNDREHQAYIVELKLDDESPSGLMTLAAVPLIVKMMHSTRTSACQQWGCFALKYILRQDDTSVTRQQVVQASRRDFSAPPICSAPAPAPGGFRLEKYATLRPRYQALLQL